MGSTTCFSWRRSDSAGPENDAWRTHSCVPRSHSCERFEQLTDQASARLSTRHARVRAPRGNRLVERVTIVIPNWNGASRLAALFERLARQSQPIHQILVVDNGSTDDSAAVAAAAGATVLPLNTNTGF